MKKYLIAITTGAAALSLAGSAAAANLVTNGSFESNGGAGEAALFISYATGWAAALPADNSEYPFDFVVDGTADLPYAFSPPDLKVWAPSTGSANGFTGGSVGSYSFGISAGYEATTLSQTITGLQIGQLYHLSFDWAAAQFTNATGATTQGWNVTFGSLSASTPTVNNPSKGFTTWMSYSTNFLATGTSQTLSFLPVATSGGLSALTMLDNVQLTTFAIPEPSTWMTIAAGAGLLGVVLRHRRHASRT